MSSPAHASQPPPDPPSPSQVPAAHESGGALAPGNLDKLSDSFGADGAPARSDAERARPGQGAAWGGTPLALALLACVAMAGAMGGPFLFDDVPLIEGNSYVHSFDHWRRWLTSTLWDTNYDPAARSGTRGFFRPLVVASYAVDWWWAGGQAWGFHLTNLLVHGANTALFWRVLRGWRVTTLGAAFGAAAFAVHPVQTEPVAWIAGRTDSLCTLGLLLATLAFRRALGGQATTPAATDGPLDVPLTGAGAAAPGAPAARAAGAGATAPGASSPEPRAAGPSLGITWLARAGAWAPCVAALGLSAAAKEAFIVFPALFGVELWAQRGRPLGLAELRRLIVGTLPWLGLAVAYVVVHQTLVVKGAAVSVPEPGYRLPLILESIGRYGVLLLWPDDMTLGRALLRYSEGQLTPRWDYALFGLGVLGSALWGAWRLRLRRPALSLGLTASLALLLPVSSVVWLGYVVLVSPRFLYVPMLGVGLTLAAALGSESLPRGGAAAGAGGRGRSAGGHFTAGPFTGQRWRQPGWRAALLGLAVASLFAFTLLSFDRSLDYRSKEVFWRRELERNPHYSHAQEFFITRELNRGRPRSALALSHRWFAEHSRVGRPDGRRAPLVASTLGALAALTPDVRSEDLTALAEFSENLADGREGRLHLAAVGLDLKVSQRSALLAALANRRQELLLVAAEARMRAGASARALELVRAALDKCDSCWTLQSNAAWLLAQLGRLPEALVAAERCAALGPPGFADELLQTLRGAQPLFAQLAAAPTPLNRAMYLPRWGRWVRLFAPRRQRSRARRASQSLGCSWRGWRTSPAMRLRPDACWSWNRRSCPRNANDCSRPLGFRLAGKSNRVRTGSGCPPGPPRRRWHADEVR